MTDWLSDTPVLAVMYCPSCETRDPLREILEVRWCAAHAPVTTGADDGDVAQAWISGTQECGEDNAKWCQMFHRPGLPAAVEESLDAHAEAMMPREDA